MKSKYIVVGGVPFRNYTGTTTFLSIVNLGIFDSEDEASDCISKEYDNCGGLINIFEVKYED